MPNYPANKLSTSDKTINILQITDLHLSTPVFVAESDIYSDDMACQHSFEAVLQQALSEDIRCDLIIVTGDLSLLYYKRLRFLLLVLLVIMM